MKTHQTYIEQSLGEPITIDVTPLVEHGDSPTAIILSLAVFTSVLVGAIAKVTER